MTLAALPSLAELDRTLAPGRPSRARRGWLVGGLALALAGAGAGVHLLKGRRHPVQYASVPVTRGDLAVTVESTGTLEALTSVEVGSEVSGRVLRELVDVNDQVRKGQIMAEIDPEALVSGLAQAQAQRRGANAGAGQAAATAGESARILARNQELGVAGIVSRADLDSSRSARDRDAAALRSAQESGRMAQSAQALAASRLQKATIRAPIAGVVLARLVEPGQTVTAGYQTPVLFKLAQDLKQMRLNVDIDEAEVGRIRAGEPATFTVEAYPGRPFPSQVVSLQMEPKVSQNVVTYLAVLSVDNADRALLPGMTCTATIQAEVRRGVLLVPNAALRFAPPAGTGGRAQAAASAVDGRHRVWVLRNGAPVAVEVRLGASDGRRTELPGGELAEGARVLTDTLDPP